MLIEQTHQKLLAMKLNGMAEALCEQRRQAEMTELDFEERLGLLVERQWLWRQDRSLCARIAYAGFKVPACIEDINYRHPRGLKRAHIDQLLGSRWVEQGRNLLLTGPTGTGKTYLACALGQRACRDDHRVLYVYAPRLFRELQAAHRDGSLPKILRKLSRADLLIIDDLGIAEAPLEQCRDLLEIIDERQPARSTLLTSQLPVAQWHALLGDATVADAILDRLVHGAYRIELHGDSMRQKRSHAE